ncbi:MAG TPA: hypothetical protein VMW25_02890, partial [Clostridia bacterium]|nr:hypothetical protein [Clostridia bacterium]
MSKLKVIIQGQGLKKFLVLSSVFMLCLLAFKFNVWAQGCGASDYDCQIQELQREYDARKDAHEKNKTDLANYKKQLVSIQQKIVYLDKQLKETEKEILEREVDLGVQEELLAARLREMYKRGRELTLLALL